MYLNIPRIMNTVQAGKIFTRTSLEFVRDMYPNVLVL